MYPLSQAKVLRTAIISVGVAFLLLEKNGGTASAGEDGVRLLMELLNF